MNSTLPEKYQFWDSYWHDSRLHSIVSDFGPETETALDDFWRSVVPELPDGAVILDLACGNGAVGLVALEMARQAGKKFTVHGVDAASIDPDKYVPAHAELLKTIDFKPRTLMEQLPYQAGQFDAVFSQFGIEFGEIPRCASEVGRVLKQGGLFCALTLAGNTQPVVNAASKQRQSQYLINNTKIFDIAVAIVQALHNIESGPEDETKDTRKYLEKFNEEVERIMQKFTHADSETIAAVVTSIQQIFVTRKQKDIREKIGTLLLIKKRVATRISRLDTVVRAALGDSALLGLKRRLSDAGLAGATSAPFAAGKVNPVGWRVTGRKSNA